MRSFQILLLFGIGLAGCAQSKKATMETVKTVIVTYYERLPGNIAVDPEGRELPFKRDTIYSVYAETTVNPDSWDQIVIKGSLYNITGEPQLLPGSVVVSDKKNHENNKSD